MGLKADLSDVVRAYWRRFGLLTRNTADLEAELRFHPDIFLTAAVDLEIGKYRAYQYTPAQPGTTGVKQVSPAVPSGQRWYVHWATLMQVSGSMSFDLPRLNDLSEADEAIFQVPSATYKLVIWSPVNQPLRMDEGDSIEALVTVTTDGLYSLHWGVTEVDL